MDNEQTEVKKLYNGNIAETRWRTNFDNLTRSYGYTYDELNRLTNAQYVRPSNPNNPNPADIIDTFNEKLSYDKNGNIQSLVRNGGMESQTTVPIMDVLTYQYDANTKNKLIKVTDATANTEGFKDGADTTEEYGYDPNGNMTRDDNKNIVSILYNHLNLPTKIVFQNGGDFPSISYLYTATGKKVAKTVNIASRNTINYTVDYLDGYQYESGKLLFFPTAEGYVKYTNGVSNPFDYVFNYTDHLGNIRLSYGINPETGMLTKIEENNYYPFGLKHGSYNTEAKIIVKHQPINGLETGSLDKLMVQKTDVLAEEMERPPLSTNSNPEFYSGYNYKYNGKELQDELGLNMYDYGARNYDPALGKFMNFDPKAETSMQFSPFAYALDNPVFFVDPDGMEARDYNLDIQGRNKFDSSGMYIPYGFRGDTNNNDNEVYTGMSHSQALEYAKLNKHVYGEGGDIGAYTLVETYNKDSGLKASLYKKGSMYVLAIAGTDFSEWNDWENSGKQLAGVSEQYAEGLSLVTDVLLKDKKIKGHLTVTGHSLGGGISEYIAMKTDIHAVTFNAAGVSLFTSGLNRNSNTDAYILLTDPLNILQRNSILPSAGGRTHILLPAFNTGSIFKGHSIDHIIEALTPKNYFQYITKKVNGAIKYLKN